MALPPSITPSPQVGQNPLANVVGFSTEKPAQSPPRVVLNAVEGWGKTTLASYIPGVAIIQVRGETGYSTLHNAGLVPLCPHASVDTWDQMNQLIDSLILNPGAVKALAIDAMSGLERLCHEHVCNTDFKGDWGERGFANFQKGYDVSIRDWSLMLAKLDKLRNTHGIMIIMLSHTAVKNWNNPMGANYDRYIADCHQKTWGTTCKWADAVIFGTFNTLVEMDPKKGSRPKGTKGTRRVAYTERTDAYDAKNRYGMPDEIDFPDDPTKSWETIAGFFKQ